MTSRDEIVISGFDFTGNMVRPWAEDGYTCYCVDIQHPKGERVDGNIVYVGADILTWLPPREKIKMAFFFPPCTDLAVSGARWFAGKGLRSLSHAILLFARAAELAEWTGAPYMIENPVSTISSYWRQPDHTFHPYEYADYMDTPMGKLNESYTKKTCLWTGNGFRLPRKKPTTALLGSKMHKLPPSEDRANLRSATPMGFARAVYEEHASL